MPRSPSRERTISGRSSGNGSNRGFCALSSREPTRQAAVSGSSAVSSSRNARASTGGLLVARQRQLPVLGLVRRRRVILLRFPERVLHPLLAEFRVRRDEGVAGEPRHSSPVLQDEGYAEQQVQDADADPLG